ncbi:MAG: LysM peptidoglycan-binding domain-containing protein [candidate division KSB1 bacterium]|nr:LysM peptidoglycan-binding domain-containing protein [candidate division KSB1 bacterium]MDZ7410251.1 LysM peptidoglycan-binding domain-containing protein [candidate division KSB1 bacterium]
MKAFSKIVLVLSFGLLLTALNGTVVAQKKMTMDEYRQQLAEWQKREADAKAEIPKVDAEIAALKAELASLDQQINKEWDDIYAMLGTDRAGVEAYRNDLKNLEAEVDGLMALSPEELFKRRAELDAMQARLNEMKKSKIGLLSEMQDIIARIEGKITQLRSRMPKAIYTEYNVQRGDYLWKISGKQDIYGDPYQWMRIYSYNRDQIKDPDLIYPQQIFKIQREVGPDEYLVAKGDFLGKIAKGMGDPTMWRRLYEANKNIIGDDPSKLYPYTVLRIPR